MALEETVDPYRWWLLADLLLFLFISAALYLQLRRDSAALQDNDLEQESSGWEMRRKFHKVLLVAAAGRSFSLLWDLALGQSAHGLLGWLTITIHWFPALLFLTAFSLLILFWAQLFYAVTGFSSPQVGRSALAVNILTYWRACDGLVGVFYGTGLLLVIYYGGKVALHFQRSKGDQDYFDFEYRERNMSPRRAVFIRVVTLCILCVMVFLAQATYFIGSCAGLFFKGSEVVYHRHHHLFDALWMLLTELMPAVIIIFTMRKQKAKTHSHSSTPRFGFSSTPSGTPNNAARFSSSGGLLSSYVPCAGCMLLA